MDHIYSFSRPTESGHHRIPSDTWFPVFSDLWKCMNLACKEGIQYPSAYVLISLQAGNVLTSIVRTHKTMEFNTIDTIYHARGRTVMSYGYYTIHTQQHLDGYRWVTNTPACVLWRLLSVMVERCIPHIHHGCGVLRHLCWKGGNLYLTHITAGGNHVSRSKTYTVHPSVLIGN